MNSVDLVLLSTAHCSVCDQALDMLLSMPELRGRSLRVLEVSADDVMLERYGPRVPVLAIGAASEPTTARRELDWPFTREQVAALLA